MSVLPVLPATISMALLETSFWLLPISGILESTPILTPSADGQCIHPGEVSSSLTDSPNEPLDLCVRK